MKIRILFLSAFLAGVFAVNKSWAEEEKRDVSTFSEIALNVPAKLYLEQGSEQSVRIVASSSTLEEIITEVKGRRLIIRFPNKTKFFRDFKPGKIEIYISVPEVDALSVSGSGDIMAKKLKSRIIDMAISGSGNIEVDRLNSERAKASISGSGNISVGGDGVANELAVSISGSGNFDGEDFEAEEVTVHTSGSGNCKVYSNGSIKARIAGSGSIYYGGNPSIDTAIAGSGKVRKM